MDFVKKCAEKSDAELVELSKKDPKFFGCLMTRYREKLFYFIKRISFFGKEDAEDILQETFIKVYRNLNEFDQSLKFSSWIYRISRNQTIDVIRKNKKHSQVLSLEAHDFDKLIRSKANLAKEHEQFDKLETVKKAVQNLPPKYREVLVLRFLEEKNYDEIVDILKKPKGTVATLIRRGRKLLQENLSLNE